MGRICPVLRDKSLESAGRPSLVRTHGLQRSRGRKASRNVVWATKLMPIVASSGDETARDLVKRFEANYGSFVDSVGDDVRAAAIRAAA